HTSSGCSPRARAWRRRIAPTVSDSVGMFDGMAEELADRTEVGLTGGRSGDLVDDRDVGGNLIARQPRSQVLDERWSIDGRAQFRNRAGCRAEPVVRSAHYRRPSHCGMALQRGAYVVRYHLEAAADDRLIGAAQDPEESVNVDARHVGGPHPLR